MAGWKKEPVDHRDQHLGLMGVSVLPPKHDALAIMPPVNDQGGIGSCVANGSSEAFEATEPVAVQPRRTYARLYIYYYGRKLEGIPSTEDSGMYIRDGVKILATKGACLESTWPYSDDARFSLQPPAAADVEAAQHKALMYYRCADSNGHGSVPVMKASIAQGFPVVFGFNVPQNFESDECAKTGILHYPTSKEGFIGGHCVVAVGYDDTMVIDGVAGAFLCRNSWGEGWGLKGNFWMPYKFITAGLADDPWTIRRTSA